MDADKVFKALADPTRRKLLDLLCERNGQPLGQLCENLEMARQSVRMAGVVFLHFSVASVQRPRPKNQTGQTRPLPDSGSESGCNGFSFAAACEAVVPLN